MMNPVFGSDVARAGAVAASVALAGLLLLTLIVTRDWTAGFDRMTLKAFAALRGPVPDAFFQAVTWLGSSYVLIPSVFLAMVLLAARRQWASASLVGLTYFGASLTTWLLKTAVGRERPLLHAMLAEIAPADWSFPSGHATHAAAFALGLWLVAARYRPRWRVPSGVVLGGLVLLVSASRLHLQVHWPSDVLAGWLVAVFWAGIAYAAACRGGGASAGRVA
ncbi:phosphatase PAP2 family protein [Thioalkalivibrio sulfidiphilus]